MRQPLYNQRKVYTTYQQELKWASTVADEILRIIENGPAVKIFPIQRGGVPTAYAVMSQIHLLAPFVDVQLVDDPSTADVIIDDLIDTGHTCLWYKQEFPSTPFLVLTQKSDPNEWIVFTWENKKYHHPILKQQNCINAHHE